MSRSHMQDTTLPDEILCEIDEVKFYPSRSDQGAIRVVFNVRGFSAFTLDPETLNERLSRRYPTLTEPQLRLANKRISKHFTAWQRAREWDFNHNSPFHST